MIKTCDQDLSRVAQEFFNGMKSLQENQNWTLKQERPLQIYSLDIAGRTVVKAETIFNISFEQTLSFFSEPEFLKFTCDEAENTQVIYQTDGLSVIHMHMKAIFPFSSREVIAINTCKVEGKKAYCGNRSCDYPCQTDPKAIRMELYIAGFILEGLQGGRTKVTSVSDMDLKGSIPAFVKNMMSIEEAKSLLKIEEKIIKHQQ